MGQVWKKLKPIENVSAADAATAVGTIAQGFIYDALVLKLGGTFVAADIPEIRLILGGKTIWRVDGAHLDEINQYYSLTNSATYLPLHFADRQAKTIAGRRVGAIDTKTFNYSDFSIEVDLDGVQSAATLEMLGVVGGPKPDPGTKNMFRSLIKATHTPSAAAQQSLNIPTGSSLGNLVKAVFAYHSIITHFELKKDGVNIIDNRPIADLQFNQNEILRTTQAGQFVYDPMVDGDQGDVLDVRRYGPDGKALGLASMEWLYTVSGSGTIVTYTDCYATLATI